MSTPVIQARGLTKKYRDLIALNNLDFTIESGRIVGVIGPNGAGKTTALQAILGLIPFKGDLNVLGMNPAVQRTELLEDVCFIADTAILPRWMTVAQLMDYVETVHRKFSQETFLQFLQNSNIQLHKKVGELSKGMMTKLHLALVMAIDAKLLVLDEPTLGLDILNRKEFYSTLLSEYFDHDKTILITTHLVEEVEHILTDVMFINDGDIVLNEEMENISEQYVEVDVKKADMDKAQSENPFYVKPTLSGGAYFYRKVNGSYSHLGAEKIPSIADLFVAMMKKETITDGV
ncbi:MAG: ABC transporter ATP-binding protein [Cellvibrionaceae bacterium]